MREREWADKVECRMPEVERKKMSNSLSVPSIPSHSVPFYSSSYLPHLLLPSITFSPSTSCSYFHLLPQLLSTSTTTSISNSYTCTHSNTHPLTHTPTHTHPLTHTHTAHTHSHSTYSNTHTPSLTHSLTQHTPTHTHRHTL